MQTIQPVQIENAEGPILGLLETLQSKQFAFLNERGEMSNLVRTMAQSAQTLDAYQQFQRTLTNGKLTAKLREQIALAVAQANRCQYSLAQHAARASKLGMTNEEILASREGRAADLKARVCLPFVQSLVTQNGSTVADLQDAGFTDAEVVEVIAQVALNIFENYFAAVAQIELDFPRVAQLAKAA